MISILMFLPAWKSPNSCELDNKMGKERRMVNKSHRKDEQAYMKEKMIYLRCISNRVSTVNFLIVHDLFLLIVHDLFLLFDYVLIFFNRMLNDSFLLNLVNDSLKHNLLSIGRSMYRVTCNIRRDYIISIWL